MLIKKKSIAPRRPFATDWNWSGQSMYLNDQIRLLTRATEAGSPDTEHPSLNTGHHALRHRQVRLQIPRNLPGPIGFTEPRRHREGVMLGGVRTSAGNVCIQSDG